MPTGWSTTSANTLLGVARGWTHWVQLHSADPGPAGTNHVLNSGTRVLATFAAPVGNQMGNDVELVWTNWQGGSTPPTHFTTWGASTGGTFHLSGSVSLTGGAPSTGGTATLPVGALVARQTVATA